VLSTVIADLGQANYAALISSLYTTIAPTIVNCALQAVASGTGSGSAAPAGSGTSLIAAPDLAARAREMLAAHPLAPGG
jgi:hypothetical protein